MKKRLIDERWGTEIIKLVKWNVDEETLQGTVMMEIYCDVVARKKYVLTNTSLKTDGEVPKNENILWKC